MKVVVTGADGFLGWHTRCRLRALTDHDVVAVGRQQWPDLADLLAGAQGVIHIAGVNRGKDAEVEQGNERLAGALSDAVRASEDAPTVVFANSVQAGTDSPYGAGKAAASTLLAAAAADIGAHYVDVRLPNLFGEHGRPRYNSFVATFVDAVLDHRAPEITDRPVDLLHAQGAAHSLIDGLTTTEEHLDPAGTHASVQGVFDTLVDFDRLYRSGDIPALLTALDVDLFNTLRAGHFPVGSPIPMTPRSDERGRLVEVVRAHGGQGQTFVSTTKPGITRGEHFHLRKIERFVVLSGQARILLRKMFTGEVVSFDVDGATPVAVDMPTMWAHNITNTGHGELVTVFWTHELFDPAAPDTVPERVELLVGNA